MLLRFALTLLFVLSACGDDDGGPARVCDPGATQTCVGVGGCAGGQACNADGTGFGACDCGSDLDAAPDPDPDAGPEPDGGPLDTGPVDAGPTGPCNPVAETGCPTGERCVWVRHAEGTGELSCVPDGTVAEGGECTPAMVGGTDDCQSGLTCLTDRCERVCDPAASGCGTGHHCALYSGFVDGMVGVCTASCDPVTQTRLFDGAPACGSPDPDVPTMGCYGRLGGPYACSTVIPAAASRTHRMAALGPPTGGAYLNGCAPGYVPALPRSSTDRQIICVATCDPVETYAGSAAERQGRAPRTCPARGATAPSEECRFSWFFTESGMAVHEIGICVDHTQYTHDHDMMPVTPEVPWPSCATLTPPDHLTWGCGPMPTM